MALIDRVKEVSKKNGYSLTEVAIKAGIGEKSIYAWKDREPTVETLRKVADVLHVSTDYLLGRTDDMNISSSDDHITDINTDGVFFFDGREVDEDTMDYIRETLRRLKK